MRSVYTCIQSASRVWIGVLHGLASTCQYSKYSSYLVVCVRAHEAPAPRVDALLEVWHVVPELVGVCYNGIAL